MDIKLDEILVVRVMIRQQVQQLVVIANHVSKIITEVIQRDNTDIGNFVMVDEMTHDYKVREHKDEAINLDILNFN